MDKDIILSKHEKRDDLVKDSFQNLLVGVGEYWGAFYRENIHRFVLDYLQINIHIFQQFLLYELSHSNQSVITATRGIGKSWILGLLACCISILYPGSRVLVCAKRKKQAKLLITSKIMGDLVKNSVALRKEIKYLKNDNNECLIEFHNGSIIEAVVSSDDSRGYRSSFLIIDEYRMLSQDMVDGVLLPFLNTPRQPGYRKYAKYKDIVEENTEVYLSSGWYSSEWSYDRWNETIKGMIEGEDMFACSLAFTTAIQHNLTTKKRIKKEMQKESMTSTTFIQEYCGLWSMEEDGAFFKSSIINPCRTLEEVFYPPSTMDYIKYKNVKNKPYKLPKVKDEIRIIACDIAISSGSINDNSIYICMRLKPDNGVYKREVVCIESYNGKEAESQAIRIKELYDDFDADYMVIDTNGAGASVWSYIQKKTYDMERGIEYDAYTCFNNDNTVDKELAKIGIPVVYSMKAYAELNSRMAMSLRESFISQKLELPITSLDAKGVIFNAKDINSNEIQKKINIEGTLLVPFRQTDLMATEMINLKHEFKEGKVTLSARGRARKDRMSALLYGNFLCDYLEQENYKKLNKKKNGGFMFFT